MYCKHYRRRTMKKIPFCKLNKKWDPVCQDCKDKDYKEYKPLVGKTQLKTKIELKKVTYKHKKADNNRFSILTNDMNRCVECDKIFDRSELNYHEIFFGNGKRKLSIKYGLVIPLYWLEYHNQIEQKGIHFDKELCLKWQKKGQLAWMQYYDKTKEDFIKTFGKNYL